MSATTSPGSTPEAEVRTTAGALRGRWEAGVAVFRGVSYAEPPVGALRFAAPRPVRGWEGVRAAVSYGPSPPQPGLIAALVWVRDNIRAFGGNPDRVTVFGSGRWIGRRAAGHAARRSALLSGCIRAVWTAFSADGDPGWPAHDSRQRLVQLLDTQPVVTAYPEEASRRLWQQHTCPALPLIGQ